MPQTVVTKLCATRPYPGKLSDAIDLAGGRSEGRNASNATHSEARGGQKFYGRDSPTPPVVLSIFFGDLSKAFSQ